MRDIAVTVVLITSIYAVGCGKKSAQRLPNSGDAFPVMPLRLEAWCDRSDIGEQAQRTVDALLKSVGAESCIEFDARYNSLKPKKIILAFEDLSDPQPITVLTDLQELSVRGNKFTSLDWTQELVELQALDASQNPLATNSSSLALETLASNLKELRLDETGITALEAAQDVDITSLSLAGNDMKQVGFLAEWSSLSELNLEGNPLEDIGFLTDLTSLRSLRLSAQLMTDLQGLQQLSGLRELAVPGWTQSLSGEASFLPASLEQLDVSVTSGLPDIDMSLLRKLPRLKRLTASGRTVVGEKTLHPSLQELTVDEGRLVDAQAISGLTGLMLLKMKHAGIAVLPDLRQLANLTSLQMDANELRIIDGKLLPEQLRSLSLESNRIEALRSPEDIPNLTNLVLKNNGIAALATFHWPQRLRTLDLSDNNIANLQPLTGLTGLNALILSRNLITNPAPLATLLALEWLDLSHNKLDTIAPLAPLANLGTLDVRSTGLPASVPCPVENKAACLF